MSDKREPDLDFDDLNPPLAPPTPSDTFFGCLTVFLIVFGVVLFTSALCA